MQQTLLPVKICHNIAPEDYFGEGSELEANGEDESNIFVWKIFTDVDEAKTHLHKADWLEICGADVFTFYPLKDGTFQAQEEEFSEAVATLNALGITLDQ